MIKTLIRLLLGVMLMTQINSALANEQGDYVVLLHGIMRSNNSMGSLEKMLTKHGYTVINIDYPSSKHDLSSLLSNISQQLDAMELDESRRMHFVGHSMGNLLIRAYIHAHPPKNIGNVVMLAPPNQGSEVADFLKSNPLFKWIYGPAGQQLGTDQEDIKHLFGDVNYPVGIIAGTRSLDPITPFILPGEGDGKVTIENTKLVGMRDHITIPTSHTFIMNNKKVHYQVAYFLKHREFDKSV